MRRNSDLEARLVEWANEYGGGRHENIGWQGISPVASIVKYHGRAPQGLNPSRLYTNGSSDEVELAVRALAKQKSGSTPAAVLRCHYAPGDADRPVRMQRLKAVGHDLGASIRTRDVRYSQHLRTAKIFVSGWLRLPFDEMLDDEASTDMLEYLIATGA